MRLPALKIALRELRGGLKGFWIYLACLALGTTAIAAAGSVSEVFTRGLAHEARTLLGADMMFGASQRRLGDEERIFISERGRVTETAAIDAMGAFGDIREQIDIRAVDANFPLIGAVTISGGVLDFQTSLRKTNGVWGTVVSQSFLDAFAVEIGETVQIGPLEAVITARLDGLPDRIGTPGTFVPDVLVSLDALVEIGRLTNGQMFNSGYRLVFKDGTTPDNEKLYEKTKTEFQEQFPNAAVRIRGPEDAVDGLRNVLELLNSFLSVIGIAALVAGGVGVAQATTTFLHTRMHSIATLKALGADSGMIRRIYILQLGFLAVIGSLIGMTLGALAPFLLNAIAGGSIPLPQAMGIYPAPLIKALVLGLLAATVFALPAIGRARATPPAALFRTLSDNVMYKTPWVERLWALAAGIALIVVSVVFSKYKMMTILLLGGAIICWGLFHLVAWLIKRIASAMAKKAKGFRRLALSNIGGAGSLASTIVPALGLGLALLTLVASVQSNLLRQISETAPANAPSMVLSQIPNDKVVEFDQIMQQGGIDIADPETFRRAPFILARITEIKDKPLIAEDVAPSERWVVDQEINLTFLADQPPEVKLTDGTWWNKDYVGDLLVSVELDVAKALKISVGDNLGFKVFGRDIKAKVASLRVVEWGTFGIGSNTAFIFSPGVLEAAKPYHVAITKSEPAQEQKIISLLGEVLPEVVVLRTRPLLQAASKIFADIALAVNAAASVVSIAGLLVLLGAFAALSQKRQNEAALLKTFGAKSGDILRLYASEFLIAGGIGALIGTLIGIGAAYPIVVTVFEAKWTFPWKPALSIMSVALIVSAIGGASVGIATLSKPVMRVLRAV
jgi:putative ABC transport system permease protein